MNIPDNHISQIANQNPQSGSTIVKEQTPTVSFQDTLKMRMAQNSNLVLSKHAANRVEQRGIDMSSESITRLNEGVKIAEEKGLKDTLILIDRTAFIVNIKNKAVVTTVNGDELNKNVFTNIDGTVIV